MGTTKTETTGTAKTKACSKKTAAKKPVTKKCSAAAATKKTKSAPLLKLIKNDPYLKDHSAAIEGRHQYAMNKIQELTNKGKITLNDFASGYLYFGLHFLLDCVQAEM